jgi:Icc protein
VLKLIQLSDCHVTASSCVPYRDEDPRTALMTIIKAVAQWGPDLVLATGDLSEDASAASYEFLAEAFARLKAPVWVTAGNHDDPASLRAHFDHCALDKAELVFEGAKADDWRVVMLNSARPGAIDGQLDEDQLRSLDQLINQDKRPAVVALHHQPWPVGSPWIDRWPLQKPEALHQCLESGTGQRLVLWGHVHQALRFGSGKVVGLSAPSTVSNSLPGQQRFTLDATGPACRWLELEPGGGFRTGLLRPQGSRTRLRAG